MNFKKIISKSHCSNIIKTSVRKKIERDQQKYELSGAAALGLTMNSDGGAAPQQDCQVCIRGIYFKGASSIECSDPRLTASPGTV
jgi:hypothetical protein